MNSHAVAPSSPASALHGRWLPCAGLVVLVLLGGCEESHRLGGPLDAAQMDAEPWQPDESLNMPVFPLPGGSADDLDNLRNSMVGDWWGVTSYNEQTSELYEVHFDADGTYSTRCLVSSPCEPFGIGSDGDRGFGWELFTLDADGNGRGEIRSRVVRPVIMDMQSVRYRPERELLSFVFGPVLRTSDLSLAQVAQVALRRGKFEEGEAVGQAVAP